MDQLTFRVIDEACLAAMRNLILAAWGAAKYNHGSHRCNSLLKHLSVRTLSDCEDIDALEEYLAHVEGKKDE